MSSSLPHIWSFDIGTGSFGIAVRSGNAFREVRSLLIPDGFASIDTARTRRRMQRTRQAHKAREEWLRSFFVKAGLAEAVLTGRRARKDSPSAGASGNSKPVWTTAKGDYRLEREFPPKTGQRTKDRAPSDEAGSKICYNSAVLRIRLLQEQPLEPWQIFKALHSAIQKRGYDPHLPWKAQERGKSTKPDDDEKATMVRVNEAQRELLALPEGCQFPCYLEAGLTGLWHPADPHHTELRQKHSAQTTRQRIFLRQTVEAELRALVAAAVKQLPSLEPHAGELLYGPAQSAYASYYQEKVLLFRERTGMPLVRGKASDWQGVLAQKIPTFDNRALSACALIPRFHATKCEPRPRADGTMDPDSLLPAEVTFLMKLKNFRFVLDGGSSGGFSVAQIREIFDDRAREVLTKQNAEAYRFTKTQLAKIVERSGGIGLLPNQSEIEAPRLSGRSRFSKPALKLVRRLVLSGKSPADLHAEALTEIGGNTDPLKGLIASDLQFLHHIKSSGGTGATWENFYLPDESLAFVENAALSSTDKIRSLIGRQNNPVVRHRLDTFWKLLRQLESDHGRPDHVAIEFVREDFMGEKAKIELARFQKERRDARAEARKEAGSGKDGLRYQLLKDQGFSCMYCESPLGLADLPNCHLDHIVPDKMGGPGGYWNFALCCSSCNAAKGKRTPWQWFHEDHREGWDAYTSRIRARTYQLRNKKIRLLTEQDASTLVQRYQTLAETAWIARLAQMLVCLHFGWPRNFAGGPRQVVVLPGGLTARVRRKYDLNSLLGQDIAALERKLKESADAKVEAEMDKKCRADKRHHALDAMVLSFLPQWTSDPTRQVHVTLPEGVDKHLFSHHLDRVVPTNLCFEKPALEESAYGQRQTPEFKQPVATKRYELRKLGYTGINPVFKLDTLKKHTATILDPAIRQAIQEFIRAAPPDADAWQTFCSGFRQPSRPVDGPLVKTVRRVIAEEIDEFMDLSKGDQNLHGKHSPALRRGDRHRGYFLYSDTKNKIRVRPVYVFQSVSSIRHDLLEKQGSEVAEIIGFFQSGCAVALDSTVNHPKTPLLPGRYKLNSIKLDGRGRITSAAGVVSEDIALSKLIAAGFRRA